MSGDAHASMSPFFEDESVTLWHGDCIDVLRQLPDASVDAVVTDPPYNLSFMGRTWDRFDGEAIDPAFMHWFAGFVDGEGCFSVHRKPQDTYDCQFSITLRADDRPILERIQRTLRMGTLSKPTAHRSASLDRADNPKARFSVSSKRDCVRLRDLFRAFPLRAKKAKDFEVWSDALDAWLDHKTGEWDDMALLRDELMQGRAYTDQGVRVDPFQMWCWRWARECLRVLKPGGHLLAFGGSRTAHRLMAGVEDAGFEVRDSIAWLYGSGFPKSLDVSKAIDKGSGENRARQLRFTAWMRSSGVTVEQINDATGTRMGSHYLTDKSQPAIATADLFDRMRSLLPEVPEEIERLVAERTGIEWTAYKARRVVGIRKGAQAETTGRYGSWGNDEDGDGRSTIKDTAPATDAARQWQGWHTALKPAFEPVVVARKPLTGTVAATVQQWGTGALNIGACRVGSPPELRGRDAPGSLPNGNGVTHGAMARTPYEQPAGRWPTNVVMDGDTADRLDAEAGPCSVNAPARWVGGTGGTDGGQTYGAGIGKAEPGTVRGGYGDSGGPSRFFPVFRYQAKAPTAQRPSYFRPTCDCEDAWPTTSPRRATSETAQADGCSTSKSGSSTTGAQSPTDGRSTTSTGTNRTTTSATSSPSTPSPISASTPGANSATASGGSPAESAGSSSQSAPTTGISPERAGQPTVAAVPATSAEWSATSVCGNCGAPTRRESHATVKPLALMQWLVRLVTPPGGVVLDPFAGSGTTVEAAILEGFQCIAIEREADYLPLILQRIERNRITSEGVPAVEALTLWDDEESA